MLKNINGNRPRAIVTGGCGFIGSHMAELLLNEGLRVTIIDNLSTGRIQNIANFQQSPNLEVVEMDIANDYHSLCSHFNDVTYVFHMAALADIVPSIEHPDEYHRSNVNGTFNILRAAVANKVKKFLYTASSSCYGIPDRYPTGETEPLRPQYPYALTKMFGEQYTMHFARVYQLPAISLRLFNVYGPRSRTSGTYGAVFGVFLKQKLEGTPYTVVGDGEQTRDFTYVTDVVQAFWQAANSELSGEIMNVGSGNSYSVNRLVELLGGEVVRIPKRPGEPDCTFADISKISRLTNWAPSISLEQGVGMVLDNIEFWRDAPLWNPDSIASATRDWFRYLGNEK